METDTRVTQTIEQYEDKEITQRQKREAKEQVAMVGR
jgi:hypothetical protein